MAPQNIPRAISVLTLGNKAIFYCIQNIIIMGKKAQAIGRYYFISVYSRYYFISVYRK